MAEIRNYTLNFGFGRPTEPGLTCAMRKLAYAEIQRVSRKDFDG
jgi:hypothetical protein